MANSADVNAGDDVLASQYNNLRADVLNISTGHTHNGTDSKLLIGLGTWTSKNSNQIYQATTDGFVVVYTEQTAGASLVATIETDSNTPPTTVRQQVNKNENTSPNNEFMISPVKKNDYYRINITDESGYGAFFIPLGV